MFQDKYNPENSSEIIGQDVKGLKENILNKIPTLIHGPCGTGKTSSVYAIAKDLGFEVREINSSDFRNKEGVKTLLGNTVNQRSLFFKGKIILIDELEGVSGRKDRGFVPEVIRIIKESSFPVVITANDPFESKFSSLRKKCKLIEFKEIGYSDTYLYLQNVLKKEGLNDFDDKLTRFVSRSSKGDLRAALIDLFTLTNSGKTESLGDREGEEELIYYLNLIFRSSDINVLKRFTDSAVINLDELLLWLEENIDKVYSGEELVNGFDALSKADVFRGRIRKRQYYRYLVYQKFYSIYKMALAKGKKKEELFNFKRNSRILKIWIANRKNASKNADIDDIKKSLMMSRAKLKKEMNYMNFLN
jgi:replication factor C large subunit